MLRKGTTGYAFTIVVTAGLACVVLAGALLAVAAWMGR